MIGYAWVFEKMVVYESNLIRVHNIIGRKKVGSFIGVVKMDLPEDPYYSLYQWLWESPKYKQRKQERKILKRLKYYGGRSMMKADKRWRGQKEIKKYLEH